MANIDTDEWRQLKAANGDTYLLSSRAAVQARMLTEAPPGIVEVLGADAQPLSSAALKQVVMLIEATSVLLKEPRWFDHNGDTLYMEDFTEGELGEVEGLKKWELRRAEGRESLIEEGLPHLPDETIASLSDATLDRVTGAPLDRLDLWRCAQIMADLRWLDCPLPASVVARRMAALLRGRTHEDLRGLLLPPDSDCLSERERQEAIREPLFAKEPARKPRATAAAPSTSTSSCPTSATSTSTSAAPPPPPPSTLTRSLSFVMDAGAPDEGNVGMLLGRCDARTLRELKAVSTKWRRRAREMLSDAEGRWRAWPLWSTRGGARHVATAAYTTRRHGLPARAGLALSDPREGRIGASSRGPRTAHSSGRHTHPRPLHSPPSASPSRHDARTAIACVCDPRPPCMPPCVPPCMPPCVPQGCARAPWARRAARRRRASSATTSRTCGTRSSCAPPAAHTNALRGGGRMKGGRATMPVQTIPEQRI